MHSPDHNVDSFLRTPTPTLPPPPLPPLPATLSAAPAPPPRPLPPLPGRFRLRRRGRRTSRTVGSRPPPAPSRTVREPAEETSAEGGQLSVGKPAAAYNVADNGGEPAATATSAGRSLRSRGEQAAANNGVRAAASRGLRRHGRSASPYVSLPWYRWMVGHLQYWIEFLMQEKKVEFRVTTALEQGMFLRISMDASALRPFFLLLSLLESVPKICILPLQCLECLLVASPQA